MPDTSGIAPTRSGPPVESGGPEANDPFAIFPDPERTDATLLHRELRGVLQRLTSSTDQDPFSNPVLLLGLHISQRLETGDLSYGAIERLVQHLSADGFVRRAERLSRYLGEVDATENAELIRKCIHGLARRDGAVLPFDAFRQAIEREMFGIVFTAHPTFTLSGELMTMLTSLATGRSASGAPLSDAERADLIANMARRAHRPDEDLSLAREHSLSLVAIRNLHEAMRRLYDVVFSVAAELYPDRWTELKPRLITIATWVGYDLDGRSDILWTDTLRNRLIVHVAQLKAYQSQLRGFRHVGMRDDLTLTLDLLDSRLALATNEIEEEIGALEANPEEDAARRRLQHVGRRMYQGLGLRLIDASQAIALIDRALAQAAEEADGSIARRLAVLRAELANYGLAMAHTHVRINSTQIHNAIRKVVNLETAPDDPRYRQSYLAAMNDLLLNVQPATTNFGSILGERTSAKRLFMVIAQMLKYADATTPVRFLIAECEAAFTVLTALYYAQLFGVADRVDISPLFETERALEAGSRVIDQLLENEHFRKYVERRGRLCVQTGYSDAGRYLGQTPAAGSIERLKIRITRLFAKHRLRDVQLVVFDTHGESIGRGAHPASFRDRLSYIATPRHLRTLADEGIPYKQETSFQGGDGYLLFATPDAAFAVVSRIVAYLADRPNGDDPYYEEPAYDYVTEFFTTVKEFQVRLMRDANYAALLNAFGSNLVYPSGSRALKRQHDAPVSADQQNAAQLRAIPHNAILLQLGLSANTIGGVGEAIAKDPARFKALYAASPRFRQMIGIIEYGLAIACPDALKAYVDTLDPGLWLLRAAAMKDVAPSEEMQRVASFLEQMQVHARQVKIWRMLFGDLTVLRKHMAEMPDSPTALIAAEGVESIRLLHGIRLAVIHEIFRLVTHIPEFSSQHNTTHQRVAERVLSLDVPAAVDQLRRIFPALTTSPADEDFGEPATYVSDDSQSYAHENANIFDPLVGLHDILRRIGGAITHHHGFFG